MTSPGDAYVVAFLNLPERCRQVLVLATDGRSSCREIAELTGRSPEQVAQEITESLRLLRRELDL